ncbi:MAG: hypothetical protein ACRDNS_26230, partial [Trebonia sp.]
CRSVPLRARTPQETSVKATTAKATVPTGGVEESRRTVSFLRTQCSPKSTSRDAISRDPDYGWHRMKIAWWSQVSGPLQIVARRIDKHLTTLGHGYIQPYTFSTAHRIEPTHIAVLTLGYSQVASAT